MRWHFLQHVPFEGPAHLAAFTRTRGAPLSGTQVWTGAPLPGLDDFDGLVVLGGPMSVHDEGENPWLAREKAFIAEAVAGGKAVVGLCLGAQLLAVALGGAVTRNSCMEIGWFRVELTAAGREDALFGRLPRSFFAFHWHGDRFSVPPGGRHIARSAACEAQGFVWGERAVGLQFHLEATDESIAALLEHCGHEVVDAPFIQDEPAMREHRRRIPEAHALLDLVLDELAARVSPSSAAAQRSRSIGAVRGTPSTRTSAK